MGGKKHVPAQIPLHRLLSALWGDSPFGEGVWISPSTICTQAAIAGQLQMEERAQPALVFRLLPAAWSRCGSRVRAGIGAHGDVNQAA